jgi:hypothetical protein
MTWFARRVRVRGREETAMAATLLLDYAGPVRTPARRSLVARCVRAGGQVVGATVLATFLAARFALLGAGFACVFAGTLLLMLGGRRGAARTIARWRERAIDLGGLWWDDIARPVRRWRGGPRRDPAAP